MQIYGSELLWIYHHPDKFTEHRHSDSGNLTFLICYVTSRLKDYVTSWVDALMVSHHFVMFDDH